MSFLNRIRKVIGNLVDNTDPLNPIVSLDILPESTSSTTCEDSVLVKSGVPVLLNDTYFGWSEPEAIQWSNIPAWDNRTWRVFFSNLDTDGLGGIATPVSTSAFTSFQELINELNNQLLNYDSSFRLIGHQDGNRILVTDLSFNPLLVGDPYFITYNFQNMELVIEDDSTGNDWLVKGRNPKDLLLSNVEFNGDTGYVFKKLQCVCDELKSIAPGTFNSTDSLIAIGASSILEVQGWFYDGVNFGNGYMEVPFTSGNQVSINALIVDGIDYIPGGSVTNTYALFQDFIDIVNGLISASGVQLATNSNNDFYVVGSDNNPISQVLTFDFYDDTVGGWFTKTWLPDTIEITLDGECKQVQLPIESQDWKLQGNSGTDPNVDFIGTNDAQLTFSVRTGNNLRSLWYGNAFIVGPSSQLQEVLTALPSIQQGINNLNNFSNVYVHSNTTQSAGFRTIRRGGTITTPLLPPANAILGFLNFQAYTGTTDVNVQTTIARIVGTPTSTSIPTSYTISTTPTGSITPLDRFFVSPNGNVGAGNYTGVSQPLSLLESQGSFGSNIRSSNISATLLDSDYTIVFTAISLTATLPTSVNKRIYNIKNASTGNLSITGSIDGTTQTIVIGGGNSRTFHGDGTTWWLI